MEKVIYAEILDRRSRVKNRIKIDKFPATIGRAYTNDVIIDDRYVCPEHVRITLDDSGDPVVEDLNSVNGMYQFVPHKRFSRLSILPDAQIQIGHTIIRFRGSEFKVKPAVSGKADKGGIRSFIESKSVGIGVFMLSVVLLMANIYLGSYEDITPIKLFGNVLPFFFLYAFWAGGWAFANRLVAHEFRFIPHLALISAAVTGFLLFDIFIDYFIYIFSPGSYFDIFEIIIITVLFAFLLGAHVCYFKHVCPKTKHCVRTYSDRDRRESDFNCRFERI